MINVWSKYLAMHWKNDFYHIISNNMIMSNDNYYSATFMYGRSIVNYD